jgi:hypothetical protein
MYRDTNIGMSVKPRKPMIKGLINAYPVKFLRNDEYCLNGTNLLYGSTYFPQPSLRSHGRGKALAVCE